MHDTAVFERILLDNGIPVWLQKSSIQLDYEGILIAVFNGVGSRLDPSDRYGIAHAFEHLPFRGTRTKPSMVEIREPLHAVGGTCGAGTSLEYTCYKVRAPEDFSTLAVETLYALTMEPLLRSDDIERERSVLYEEYKRLMSDEGARVWSEVLRALFSNHPLGHEVIGSLATMETMTAGELRSFHDQYYHCGTLQLICGGMFSRNSSAMLSLLNDSFGKLLQLETSRQPVSVDHALMPRGSVTINETRCRRDYLILSFPSTLRNDRDRVIRPFLANVLANRPDDLLLKKLRDEMGIVYESHLCHFEHFRTAGMSLFQFFCPTDRSHFEKALSAFYEALAEVTPDYIEKRKGEAQLLRRTGFTHPISACEYAVSELTERGVLTSHSEDSELFDSLDPKEILAFRDELLNGEPFAVHIAPDQ